MSLWEKGKLNNPKARKELDVIALSTLRYLKDNNGFSKSIEDIYTNELNAKKSQIYKDWKNQKLSNEQLIAISKYISDSIWKKWISGVGNTQSFSQVLESCKKDILKNIAFGMQKRKDVDTSTYIEGFHVLVSDKIAVMFKGNQIKSDSFVSKISSNIKDYMLKNDSDLTDDVYKKVIINILKSSSEMTKEERIFIEDVFKTVVANYDLMNNGKLHEIVKKEAAAMVVDNLRKDNLYDKDFAIFKQARIGLYSIHIDKLEDLKLLDRNDLFKIVLNKWKSNLEYKNMSEKDSNELYQAFTVIWKNLFSKFECQLEPSIFIKKQ